MLRRSTQGDAPWQPILHSMTSSPDGVVESTLAPSWLRSKNLALQTSSPCPLKLPPATTAPFILLSTYFRSVIRCESCCTASHDSQMPPFVRQGGKDLLPASSLSACLLYPPDLRPIVRGTFCGIYIALVAKALLLPPRLTDR